MWYFQFTTIFPKNQLFLKDLPPQSLRDSFSSGNWYPFVCFADISPVRGITLKREPDMPSPLGNSLC